MFAGSVCFDVKAKLLVKSLMHTHTAAMHVLSICYKFKYVSDALEKDVENKKVNIAEEAQHFDSIQTKRKRNAPFCGLTMHAELDSF